MGMLTPKKAAKNWNVESCTRQFEKLCGKAFTRRAGTNIPGLGNLISHYNHSKYETRPLQEALIEAYSEDEYLFGGSRLHTALSGADVKVAVTSTSAAGSAVVLANYNRLCSEKRECSWSLYYPQRLSTEVDLGSLRGYTQGCSLKGEKL